MGYLSNKLTNYLNQEFNIELSIVRRWVGVWVHKDAVIKKYDPKVFRRLPKRWVVERSFAWLGKYRRLSKGL